MRFTDLALHQKGIALFLIPDGGQRAVAGDYHRLIRQDQDRVVQRAHDLLHRAAGEVSAADGSGEEGVAGDEFLLSREVEADAAFGVAGGVQDIRGERSGGDCFSGRDAAVDFYFSRRRHADPDSLRVQHLQQGKVVLVKQNGCACRGAKFHGSADVVDVGVGDDDLLNLEIVFTDDAEDVFDFVTRVDDHGFVRGLVADDGAVALQWADRDDFVDHGFIVASWVDVGAEFQIINTGDTGLHRGDQNLGVLPMFLCVPCGEEFRGTCRADTLGRQYARVIGRVFGGKIPAAWISGS